MCSAHSGELHRAACPSFIRSPNNGLGCRRKGSPSRSARTVRSGCVEGPTDNIRRFGTHIVYVSWDGVLQLTYDDLQGRFPWEPGYAAPYLQPRPGTFGA
jgi:hypothetical protein